MRDTVYFTLPTLIGEYCVLTHSIPPLVKWAETYKLVSAQGF